MIIFSASHATAQNTVYYEFLPNAAGEIDKDGFDIGYHAVFSQWDGNGDQNVSEEELFKVLFSRLDKDTNNYLTAEEWKVAQKYFLNITSFSLEFKKLDLDGDANLTVSEFDSAMKNSGLFSYHDTNRDGLLTRKELNAMIYRLMDLDKSGFIDQKEFGLLRVLFID